jgi:hypothetical protein
VDLILRGKNTPLLNMPRISRLKADVCDRLHVKEALTVAYGARIFCTCSRRLLADSVEEV